MTDSPKILREYAGTEDISESERRNLLAAADEIERLRKLKATTPPAPAQPLTDEQILNLAQPFGEFRYGDAQGHKRIGFARAIEAAHGITKEEKGESNE